jgi:hypothetical protein
VHSQVAQDVALRLKKAMEAFFRRLKAGENPGYPRFRGTGRCTSLTYPQWENGGDDSPWVNPRASRLTPGIVVPMPKYCARHSSLGR